MNKKTYNINVETKTKLSRRANKFHLTEKYLYVCHKLEILANFLACKHKAKDFSKNVCLCLWYTVDGEGFGTEYLRYIEPFVPALSTSTTCSALLDETWPLRSRNGTLRKRIFKLPQSSIATIYSYQGTRRSIKIAILVAFRLRLWKLHLCTVQNS